MSSFKQFVRKAVPIVLTVVGSASTIAAVIFAAKEGPKYQKILEEKGDEMKPVEKVTTAVKVFAPAIGCAAASIACGVGAHMMDMHTQASITGAYIALKQAYRKHVSDEKELPWVDENKDILMDAERDRLPPDVMREVDEKVYTVHLKDFADDLDEIDIQATKEQLLWKIIAVNMELGRCGELTLNRLLELFELSEYKISGGDGEGWSFAMLGSWNGNEFLMFDYIHESDGSLTCYPLSKAYDGYLTDYGLDWDHPTAPDALDYLSSPHE